MSSRVSPVQRPSSATLRRNPNTSAAGVSTPKLTKSPSNNAPRSNPSASSVATISGLNKTPMRKLPNAAAVSYSTHRQQQHHQSSDHAVALHAPVSGEVQQLRSTWAEVSKESKQAFDKAIAVNQTFIDQIAARCRRAEELGAIMKSETRSLEIDLAKAEAEGKELEAKRRALIDSARKLELEAFQARRRQSVTTEKDRMMNRHHNGGDSSSNNASTSKLAHSALVHLHSVFNSPKAALDEVATAQKEFFDYSKRLDSAKALSAELARECDANEKTLQRKQQERQVLAKTVEELETAVSHMKKSELLVDDAVKNSQTILRTAGAKQVEIPSLQRSIRANGVRLQKIKLEREEIVKFLMAWVEKDDEKLRRMQMISVNAAKQASAVLPSVIRDMQSENEEMQKSAFQLIDEAEKDRAQMEAIAGGIAEKLALVESKLQRPKLPSSFSY